MDAPVEEMDALEKELLSKGLKPAKPVGLRYDRLEREGLVYRGRGDGVKLDKASHAYFLCNGLLLSRLLAGCKKVLMAYGEDWLRELPGLEKKEVKRVCLSLFRIQTENSRAAASLDGTRENNGELAVPVDTYEKLPFEHSSFDGVLVDSSILLNEDSVVCLRELRRTLKPGGRILVFVVNWEYEMAEKNVAYETSFKRYGGKVYLGLIKRTIFPPKEIEYICLLDPAKDSSGRLASMTRDELRRLTIADVPEARQNILSVELIEIPQMTATFLTHICKEAGFQTVTVAGAPGILAMRFFEEFSSAALLEDWGAFMERVCESLALSFPFVSPSNNPHLVAVCKV